MKVFSLVFLLSCLGHSSPLNFNTPPTVDGKSQAIPFIDKPDHLDGSYIGDAGFDPFNLGKGNLKKQRIAEIKHGRLAMLASVGWPIAELYDQKIANWWGLEDRLTSTGLVPSLLNGGLEKINPFYWLFVFTIAAFFELNAMDLSEVEQSTGNTNFDILNFSETISKEEIEDYHLAEIKHGRLAMLAVLSYVCQEAFLHKSIVEQTPFLF
jgi:hypothetical protein